MIFFFIVYLNVLISGYTVVTVYANTTLLGIHVHFAWGPQIPSNSPGRCHGIQCLVPQSQFLFHSDFKLINCFLLCMKNK